MKQKTKQAARKRFHFSSTGKVSHRAVAQAHFNGRDTGSQTRKKRGGKALHSTDSQRVADLVPYPL